MKRLVSKKKLAIASAGFAVLVGGGAAVAASEPGGPSSGFFDSVAKHLGISREELDDATRAAALEQVDAALEAGKITEEQAARMRERIESGQAPSLFGGRFFHDHDEFGFGPHGGPVGAVSLDAAAMYLGLESDELRTRLQAGDTLAEVAKAEEESVDGLVDTLVAAAKKRLDAAVEEGNITGEGRDEMLEVARAGIRRIVEDGFPHRGHRGHGPGLLSPESESEPEPQAVTTL